RRLLAALVLDHGNHDARLVGALGLRPVAARAVGVVHLLAARDRLGRRRDGVLDLRGLGVLSREDAGGETERHGPEKNRAKSQRSHVKSIKHVGTAANVALRKFYIFYSAYM